MPQATAGTQRPDAALIAALERADYHPLWTRYKAITPVSPSAKDPPMLWRWADFVPLADRAAREVPIDDVERRAIIMVNPAFGGRTQSTSNLLAAFTVLEPGDRAVPHRHTAAAIRFATLAEGAVTVVNGRRCEMHEGDLVLTPPWCWHGHINEGDMRTYWFDAANMPLICGLDANFFESGSRLDNDFWKTDAGVESAPKYRYPGEDTRGMLTAMAPAEDGQRTLRYVNPLTGGPIMPTLDCYANRLARGAPTRAQRGTHNAICLVVAGEGRSTVGERRFEWSRHDVFTIPHWTWFAHEALSFEADLFTVTDRSVMDALGLLRIELE